MGLFSLTMAGGAFLLIGAYESLTSSSSNLITNSLSSSPTVDRITNLVAPKNPNPKSHSSSSFFYILIAVFSFLFAIDSLFSLFNAINMQDGIGSAIQLQVLAISALFLLYSILGLVSNFSNSIRVPSSLLDLILLFAFVEEFLLYYLQKKDTSGIENRYFDLLLVPISICVVSTVLELKSSSKSNNYARTARGIGLILQGMWFLQMGISFYTNMIVHGCSLHEKSRGNYTIKCKGHSEYHRARGIATLQFNCHLALLVVLVSSVYSIMAKKNRDGSDFMQYKPLGAEMQQTENNGHFTLDSDEDEIKEEDNSTKERSAVVEMVVNGYGSHE
ncbi:hypothetical protein JCGZ_06289 [Jatropha curcas]|uniref:Uncharacterized protein n=1 Tax=Jatropha curcas TaxID=180498 RepID=A0A067KQK1_JATCU|nr:uncharacterized protein LOC105634992 [Jatropha curcas]KDP37233.1 hypothetical protein JCGZ_06289 [Jatropha curcas]